VSTSSADTLPRSGHAPHTILTVEPDVLVRLVIADYLRECGYRVFEASDAAEAVAILETPTISINVLFTEARMSGAMDGFGLAQWIRVNRPGTRVLLTTGATRSAHIAGELCEAGPLMKKPYAPQNVVDRIKRLLAKSERAGPPELSIAQA
jgi:DNA-binding response OmpR family regulator